MNVILLAWILAVDSRLIADPAERKRPRNKVLPSVAGNEVAVLCRFRVTTRDIGSMLPITGKRRTHTFLENNVF